MRIDHTRKMVRAALGGRSTTSRTRPIRCSGWPCRLGVPGVPSDVLRPRDTWADPAAYDAKAAELARMFAENFGQYADGVSEAVRVAGPRIG